MRHFRPNPDNTETACEANVVELIRAGDGVTQAPAWVDCPSCQEEITKQVDDAVDLILPVSPHKAPPEPLPAPYGVYTTLPPPEWRNGWYVAHIGTNEQGQPDFLFKFHPVTGALEPAFDWSKAVGPFFHSTDWRVHAHRSWPQIWSDLHILPDSIPEDCVLVFVFR